MGPEHNFQYKSNAVMTSSSRERRAQLYGLGPSSLRKIRPALKDRWSESEWISESLIEKRRAGTITPEEEVLLGDQATQHLLPRNFNDYERWLWSESGEQLGVIQRLNSFRQDILRDAQGALTKESENSSLKDLAESHQLVSEYLEELKAFASILIKHGGD